MTNKIIVAPDKLHCMHRLNGDYSCSTTPFGGSVEYICKDALLKWAKKELENNAGQYDRDYDLALNSLIDKLNSM